MINFIIIFSLFSYITAFNKPTPYHTQDISMKEINRQNRNLQELSISPSDSASTFDSSSITVSHSPSVSSFITPSYSYINTRSIINSPTATATCPYRIYNAANDFSSIQGSNGWYYGYYNSGTFTQFTNYAISSTGSVGSVYSWNYNVASNGIISSTMIMPNGANSCNTQSYGDITPVLRWYNPIGSCYQDITLTISISRGSNGGVFAQLTVNGNIIYSNSNGGTLTYTNSFNLFGVSSIELSIGPLNQNCDYGQTTYSLNISPIGNSATSRKSISTTSSSINTYSPIRTFSNSYTIKNTISSLPSQTSTPSPRQSFSSSVSQTNTKSTSISKSPSISVSSSRSPYNSNSVSRSATATATVFYTGNWTDYGSVYWNVPLSNTESETISECMIRCSLNPSCGGISVNTPCFNIPLNSPNIYTTVCANCFIIPMEGVGSGTFVPNAGWESFIIYDKMFPPTTTSISTKSQTVSSLPTSSLQLFTTFNMCSPNNNQITLPIINSYTNLHTNLVATYGDNLNCQFTINGGNNYAIFQIDFISFTTEVCCDFLKIYDATNTQVFSYAGSTIPSSFLIRSSYIKLQFITDGSVVLNGVSIRITLIYPTSSGSSSFSTTNSLTPTLSKSSSSSQTSFNSISSTKSISNSKSPFATNSISSSAFETRSPPVTNSMSPSAFVTKSPSISKSNILTYTGCYTYSPYSTNSNFTSHSPISTSSILESLSRCSTNTGKYTNTLTSSTTNTPSVTAIQSPSYNTPSNVTSISQSVSSSQTVVPSPSSATSPSSLFSNCPSNSISGSISTSISISHSVTLSPTVSPSPVIILSDADVGKQLLTQFVGNKTSLSSDEATTVINTIQDLPHDQIKDVLRTVGILTLGSNPNGSFSISTTAFDFHAQVLPQKPLVINSSSFGLNVPKLDISGSAVSLISWNSNPYQSNTRIDTKLYSVSVSSLNGTELSINNLSTPLQFTYALSLPSNDTRVNIPNYRINCVDDITYIISNNKPIFIQLVKNNSGYIIPCPDGEHIVSCDSQSTQLLVPTLVTFNCPVPKYEAKCVYWSFKTNDWASDGCYVVSVTKDTLVCNCTHMTDFGSRLDAVYKSNKDIFAGAADVYSLDGLIKFKQFYITFGSIAIVGLITFLIGLILDIRDSRKYYDILLKDPIVKELKHQTGCLIDVCYEYSVSFEKEENKTENNTEKEIKPIEVYGFYRFISIWWNRLIFQHSHISAFFRFDPRLPRLFRLLIIFVAQFNSLFLSAFLYSFKYGDTSNNIELPQITITETIVLAIITAVLNVPIITFFVKLMNTSGIDEFKWRYPILYDELIRRHAFEQELSKYETDELDVKLLNIIKFKDKTYIENLKKSIEIDKNKNDFIYNNTDKNEFDNDDHTIIDMIFIYLFNQKRKKGIIQKKGSIDKAYLIANRDYPITPKKSYLLSYLPFHTIKGGLVFFLSIGWFIWCLNYLLLFAAHNAVSVSNNMLTSFGISELSTVLVTQPIVLFFMLCFAYAMNKLSNRFTFLKSVKRIPSLYYFSDPFVKPYSSLLATGFAYRIFLNGPADISQSTKVSQTIKDLGYTTLNGVIEGFEHIDHTQTERDTKMIELYELLKNPDEISGLTNVIYINDTENYKYKEEDLTIKELKDTQLNFYKFEKIIKIDKKRKK
jgi:hypothetical protein